MNAAATGVMNELPDVVLGYGVSDEFRCVLGVRVHLPLTPLPLTPGSPTPPPPPAPASNFGNRGLMRGSFVMDRGCGLFDRREMYGILPAVFFLGGGGCLRKAFF